MDLLAIKMELLYAVYDVQCYSDIKLDWNIKFSNIYSNIISDYAKVSLCIMALSVA